MAESIAEYKKGTRVVVINNISGVAEGTEGKVGRAIGLDLKRYRVQFDNGVSCTSVAHNKLVPVPAWPALEEARIEAAQVAKEAALAAFSADIKPTPKAVAPEASSPAADAGLDPRLAALAAKSKAAKSKLGVEDAAPSAEVADNSNTVSTDADSVDPRIAALTAKSRGARKDAGIDVDAAATPDPVTPVEPIQDTKTAPPVIEETVKVPEGYFPTDNRVADLLKKFSG